MIKTDKLLQFFAKIADTCAVFEVLTMSDLQKVSTLFGWNKNQSDGEVVKKSATMRKNFAKNY